MTNDLIIILNYASGVLHLKFASDIETDSRKCRNRHALADGIKLYMTSKHICLYFLDFDVLLLPLGYAIT